MAADLLEADKIAHGLIEPGAAAYDDVVREFGRGILTPDGRVDRAKLGAIVFADAKRLARLNAIVHPLVLAAQDRELAAIERAEPHAIAVVEAALLIEARLHGSAGLPGCHLVHAGTAARAADASGRGPGIYDRASTAAHRRADAARRKASHGR